MPGVVRLGDTDSGHGSCLPRKNNSASSDVFVNGKGVHRQGDTWLPHPGVGIHCAHSGSTAQGSPTVFVNGKAVARIGDPISCGGTCATGSSDVIIG